MKKVFLFLTSAMICAAMVACGGNNNAADTTAIEEAPVVEETEIEAPAEVAEPAAEAVAENSNARQQAIMDAAQQICNCGNIATCINTVIDQSFAQYAKDEDFKAAVKAEATKCLAEKAKQKGLQEANKAAKEGANKALNEGLKALGKK